MKADFVSYIMIAVGAIILIVSPVIDGKIGSPVFSEKEHFATTVIIDPGHGGEDGGASGVTGVLEKGINLSISQKLRTLLSFCGVSTVMTRDEDVSIYDEGDSVRRRKASDIRNRVKCVNRAESPVLLSVHLNFFPQPDCRGAQVFYSANNTDSAVLAECVQESLRTGMADGNHRIAKKAEKSIYLLNNVNCPAVLAECGFLSNPDEESLLVRDEYQKRLAACIAAGYLQFSSGQGESK